MTDDKVAGRDDGPVAEAGDSWSDHTTAWSPPAAPTGTRPRAAKVAIGAAVLLVFVVIATITQLPRSAGTDTQPPPAAPGFPSAVTPPAAVDSAAVGLPASTAARPGPSPPGTGPAAQPAVPTAGPTGAPTVAPTTVWTTLTVNATRVWNKGDSVQTNRTRLQLQPTGDLVVIDEFDTVRWHSGTAGHGDHAVFQNDGHFVVYGADNQTWWSSGTAGHSGAVLVLAADGDVNIVFNGTVIWSSNTAH
jgi:hypothetical protein